MSQDGRPGQSTIEYLVFFSIIVAALIAMQVYIKRGMQGKIRGYAEQLTQDSAYSPGATNSLSTITRNIEEAANTFIEKRPEPEGRVQVSESRTQFNQVTDRLETTLPFADEPRRWQE